MALMVVILLTLGLGLIIITPMTFRNNFAKPLENYLEALGHHDADGAYNMVCSVTRQASQPNSFVTGSKISFGSLARSSTFTPCAELRA